MLSRFTTLCVAVVTLKPVFSLGFKGIPATNGALPLTGQSDTPSRLMQEPAQLKAGFEFEFSHKRLHSPHPAVPPLWLGPTPSIPPQQQHGSPAVNAKITLSTAKRQSRPIVGLIPTSLYEKKPRSKKGSQSLRDRPPALEKKNHDNHYMRSARSFAHARQRDEHFHYETGSKGGACEMQHLYANTHVGAVQSDPVAERPLWTPWTLTEQQATRNNRRIRKPRSLRSV